MRHLARHGLDLPALHSGQIDIGQFAAVGVVILHLGEQRVVGGADHRIEPVKEHRLHQRHSGIGHLGQHLIAAAFAGDIGV